MPLHPPSPRRERILNFGYSGTGKSSNWLSIAYWLSKTKSPTKMFVVDSDRTWEGMRPPDNSLDNTVVAFDVEQYDDIRSSIREIRKAASKDDWIVGDMADFWWNKSQDAYFDKAFDVDIDEFYIAANKAGESVGGDYGMNWQIINKMHAAILDPVIRFPGHVFACAPADKVQEANKRTGKGGDTFDIQQLYGKYGIKPVGQKRLQHNFHSILLSQDTPQGWTLSTVRERNPPMMTTRELLNNVKITMPESSFVNAYLIGVAGWSLA